MVSIFALFFIREGSMNVLAMVRYGFGQYVPEYTMDATFQLWINLCNSSSPRFFRSVGQSKSSPRGIERWQIRKEEEVVEGKGQG